MDTPHPAPASPATPPRPAAAPTPQAAAAWRITHTNPDDPFTAKLVLYADGDPAGLSLPLIADVADGVADVLDRQVAVLYPADEPASPDGDEETPPVQAVEDAEPGPAGWLKSRGEQFSALIGSKQADAYLSKLPLRTQAIIGGVIMLAVIILYFYTQR